MPGNNVGVLKRLTFHEESDNKRESNDIWFITKFVYFYLCIQSGLAGVIYIEAGGNKLKKRDRLQFLF